MSRRNRRRVSASATPSTACRMTSIVTFCAIGSDRDAVTRAPAIDFLAHQPLHQFRVAAHPLAMERREEKLSPRQVLGGVEEQHRPAADERAQDVVAVVLRRGVAGQQSPDRVAVARDDAPRHRPRLDREVGP